MICIREVLEEFAFAACKSEVAVNASAVCTFAGISGDCENCDVGRSDFSVNEGSVHVQLAYYSFAEKDAERIGRRILRVKSRELDVLLVPFADVLIHRKAVSLKTFCNVADIWLVHISRTCTACNKVVRTYSVESHVLHIFHREGRMRHS